MAGMSVSLSNYSPVHDSRGDTDKTHAGEVDVQVTNFYGLYGISRTLNLSLNLPYKHWKQFEVEHEDIHHRNEVQTGPGDLTIGVRGIIVNEFYGPGQRFFIDGALSLPTGSSYKINPFSDEADSVDHFHFALGTGQVSYSLGAEWWWRSEFPFILGFASNVRQAVTESKVGFKPGTVINLTLHAIRQTPVIQSVFPYLQLDLRREWPDKWNGDLAPNSGAIFLDVSGQFIYEVNESSSLVFTVGYPLWQVFEGSQLSGMNYALSYRYISF